MEYKCKVCKKPVKEIYIHAFKQKKCWKCWQETKGKKVYNEKKGAYLTMYEITCKECGEKKLTVNKRGKFCSTKCSTKFNRREGNINIVL